jgi:hypothetical protein
MAPPWFLAYRCLFLDAHRVWECAWQLQSPTPSKRAVMGMDAGALLEGHARCPLRATFALEAVSLPRRGLSQCCYAFVTMCSRCLSLRFWQLWSATRHKKRAVFPCTLFQGILARRTAANVSPAHRSTSMLFCISHDVLASPASRFWQLRSSTRCTGRELYSLARCSGA